MTTFFQKQNETLILQEISDTFSSTPLITRNCIKSINNFLYFLNTREISRDNLNNILIFLLKSFQSKEQYLKHVVYNTVIEISKNTDKGFLGVNIFMKDYVENKQKDVILKSLFTIIPNEMIQDFLKYIKECFISGNESLINAGVLILLYKGNDLALKNNNLISENLNITDDIYGYQRLLLLDLYNKKTPDYIYKNEAGIMSVRLAYKNNNFEIFKNFLNTRLSDTYVFFEACKLITRMKEEYALQYTSIICQNLRNYLKSENFYEKFLSLSILSNLSQKFPKKVEILNKEIEEIIQENSKTLTMLAISTLLRTGTETTIDRFIKYLPEYLHEMDDNFKKLILNALFALTIKNNSKIDIFLTFVRKCLLDKGNYEFKVFIIGLLKKLNEYKTTKKEKVSEIQIEKILDIFMSYLEDCEYSEIASEILGFLGKELSKTKNYKKYLLHVYNRLILEDNKGMLPALQCLYDVFYENNTLKTKDKSSLFLEEGDELISQFYMNNIKNLDIPEENLEEDVMRYYKKYKLTNNKEEVEYIKENREIILNQEDSEISVKLIKIIKKDKVVLNYKIENNYTDIEIKKGVLGIKVKDTVERFTFENLLPSKSIEFSHVIQKEVNLKVNNILDVEICLVDDYSDIESETIHLNPYQITYFDLMSKTDVEKGAYSKTIKFNLNCDFLEGIKRILDLVNLKIINQEKQNELVLCGEFEGKRCVVECYINYDKVCKCTMEIFCDDEKILEECIKYFN